MGKLRDQGKQVAKVRLSMAVASGEFHIVLALLPFPSHTPASGKQSRPGPGCGGSATLVAWGFCAPGKTCKVYVTMALKYFVCNIKMWFSFSIPNYGNAPWMVSLASEVEVSLPGTLSFTWDEHRGEKSVVHSSGGAWAEQLSRLQEELQQTPLCVPHNILLFFWAHSWMKFAGHMAGMSHCQVSRNTTQHFQASLWGNPWVMLHPPFTSVWI